MRKIVKNPEPRSWTQYRKTHGVQFEPNNELRQSLLEEQGYICTYCMRRIPTKDAAEQETSKIEHIKSKQNHPDLQLKYNNLVVCCPGRIERSSSHCDKKKGNADISFDLFSDAFFTTLSYSSKEGTIYSSNSEYDDEMNDVLNLNLPLLKENRFRVLKAVKTTMNKRGWTKATLSAQLQQWDSKDREGKYNEYCGIAIWYLKTHLNNINR